MWQNSPMRTRSHEPAYRGRFAPSPTGPLHFGSLVAAVGSFLDARSCGGAWLLRMEDLDAPRVVPGAADDILRTLEACGLHWDGEVVYQGRRGEAYHAALHRLRELARVYPCCCSRREIADSAITGIEGYVYPGTCRGGLAGHRCARALRLRVDAGALAFEDRVQGHVAQDVATEVGDFVLYRADRVFAYQLAVVVDDTWQGITDVVRGADLLESTPRQMFLQRLLGWPALRYAHLPVVVNKHGEKLSKQTLAVPVDERDPAPALWQALDFLGQAPPAGLARAAPEDLLSWALGAWDLGRVPRRRAQPEPNRFAAKLGV
jgi:glutamyl-Q tRNA(Asp) synthetase